MSEKPILFSTPMVQAILVGRKIMTRRIIKNQLPEDYAWIGWVTSSTERKNIGCCGWEGKQNLDIIHHYAKPRYQVGDVLWVRETWADTWTPDSDELGFVYKADGVPARFPYWGNASNYKYKDEVWKPSIFMPRRAARLFLKVTNVRVERLQDISVEDVIAEGINTDNDIRNPDPATHESIKNWNYQYAQFQYKELWDKLNANRGYGWDVNPWVWVIEFKKCTF